MPEFADDVILDVINGNELSGEQLKSFKCENPNIEFHIRNSATSNNSTSKAYIDTENGKIVAFASFCCSAIMSAIIDEDDVMLAPERHGLSSAIEIKFFAVDVDYKHMHYRDAPTSKITLSVNIFRNVMDHLKTISQEIICADYFVLYSLPEAVNFYSRSGFHRFDGGMVGDGRDFVACAYVLQTKLRYSLESHLVPLTYSIRLVGQESAVRQRRAPRRADPRRALGAGRVCRGKLRRSFRLTYPNSILLAAGPSDRSRLADF